MNKPLEKTSDLKFLLFKSNTINSSFSDEETEKIISYVEEKGFKVSDFYYTKNQNKIVLLMKYNVLMSICLPNIEDITYEYPLDNSYVDILVKRKGMQSHFRWRVLKSEIQNRDNYHFFMLKKVALTQALRIIFSDIFHDFDFVVYGEDEYYYERQENKNYTIQHLEKEDSENGLETFIEYWNKLAQKTELDAKFWWEKVKKVYKSLHNIEIKDDYAITEKEKQNLKEIVEQIIKLPK